MIWKKHCIHGWYILSAFLFLAACNGDGGGSGGTAQAPAEINVSALLTRSQENPAFTNFSSSGTGSIAVDPATRKISGVIVTSGVLGTAAHIHSAVPGAAGPVEIALTGGPSVWSIPDGTILTPDQLSKLNAGQLYFNIHSAKAPAGEIRGQLTQLVRFASLSAANETPPISSTAGGTGALALNPVNGQISGFVRTSGITASAAHIHQAAAGVAGPVIVPLTETASGSGIWAVPVGATLTPAQIIAFNANELYYNIHSAAFPAGEIRGQIMPATLNIKTALLNGTQEVPSVATTASGTGIAVLNTVTREIFGDAKTAGLSGTIAHIHEAAVGVSGGVRVSLDKVVIAPPNDLWITRDSERILTPALVSAFTAGNLYFNIHTTANPGGEIRGQLNSAATLFTLGGGTLISAPSTPGTPQQPVVFPSSGVSLSNHIQLIFDTYCIACHATARTAAFLPLTPGASYVNLVNVPATNPFLPGLRVIPGNSTSSVLFKRVSGIGLTSPAQRMPLGGPFLDTLNPSAINAIKGWIDEGALNN